MVRLLIFNFFVMFCFNLAHPVTPEMLIYKESPAYVNALLLSMMSLAVFVSSPKWGQLSSKWEIKKIMVWTPFFYGLMQLGFAFFYNPYIMLMFRFAAGLFAAGWTVALTIYVNKISDTKSKTKNFGLILVTSALGGIVGQLVSGKIGLLSEKAFYIPFFMQATLTFLIALMMLYYIKPLVAENTSKSKKKVSFNETIKIIKRNNLTIPFLSMLILVISLALYTSNIGYYTAEQFGFDSLHISYINCYTNLIILLVNLFIVGKLEKYLSSKAIIRGQIIIAVCAVLFALVISTLAVRVLFLSIFIIAVCAIRPVISKLVSTSNPDEVGILLGTVNSVNALGVIIGASSAGFLYANNINWPFYAMFLVLIVGFIINLFWRNNAV